MELGNVVKKNGRRMLQCPRQYYYYSQLWCCSYSSHKNKNENNNNNKNPCSRPYCYRYNTSWHMRRAVLPLLAYFSPSLFLAVCVGRLVVHWRRRCCGALIEDREPLACGLLLLTVLGMPFGVLGLLQWEGCLNSFHQFSQPLPRPIAEWQTWERIRAFNRPWAVG